jgi:hypothetical protein
VSRSIDAPAHLSYSRPVSSARHYQIPSTKTASSAPGEGGIVSMMNWNGSSPIVLADRS